MTNGEKLVKVFPDIELYKKMHGGIQIDFDSAWWNAEYVDAISRSEVLKLMQDNWHTHNGDWAMQESMDDIRALPSVTPQEPILDRVRAEIEDLNRYYDNDYFSSNKDAMFKCDEVMQIIDKYKGEK